MLSRGDIIQGNLIKLSNNDLKIRENRNDLQKITVNYEWSCSAMNINFIETIC
jgi:hypothetical protein